MRGCWVTFWKLTNLWKDFGSDSENCRIYERILGQILKIAEFMKSQPAMAGKTRLWRVKLGLPVCQAKLRLSLAWLWIYIDLYGFTLIYIDICRNYSGIWGQILENASFIQGFGVRFWKLPNLWEDFGSDSEHCRTDERILGQILNNAEFMRGF